MSQGVDVNGWSEKKVWEPLIFILVGLDTWNNATDCNKFRQSQEPQSVLLWSCDDPTCWLHPFRYNKDSVICEFCLVQT